jgi:hypothetical protein
LRAASGQIAFGFLEKNRRRCDAIFLARSRETRDGRWLEWSAGALMVAVDVAIAHRGPRDVAGWSMVGAPWAISCKAATVNKARAISFTHDEIKAHSQRIKDIAPEKR